MAHDRSSHDKRRQQKGQTSRDMLPLQAIRKPDANSDNCHADHAAPLGRTRRTDAEREPHCNPAVRGTQAPSPRFYPTRRTRGQKIIGIVAMALLCLVMAGCAKSVTLQDIPVSGRAESIAKAIRITDISAAAAGSFLTTLYDTRKISEATFRQYTETIGPAVQAALDESREALKVYITTQSTPAYDNLQTAFGKLAEVAERLANLARTHGWGA